MDVARQGVWSEKLLPRNVHCTTTDIRVGRLLLYYLWYNNDLLKCAKQVANCKTLKAVSIHTEEIPPKHETRQNKDAVTSPHTLTFLTTDSTRLLYNVSTVVVFTPTYSAPTSVYHAQTSNKDFGTAAIFDKTQLITWLIAQVIW